MSKVVVRYLKEDEYDAWDAFADRSEYGTIFHKCYWNKAIYTIDRHVSIQVIGCFKGEELVAGMVMGTRKKFKLIRTMVPPYASSFYGPLIRERETGQASKAESFRHEIMDALLEFIEKEYQVISFSLPPGFKDIRSFNWRNYSSEVYYTYRAEMKDAETLFSRFLPALRRQIKKGEKLPYQIRDASSPAEIAAVYDLIHTSYMRQDHPIRFNREQLTSFLETPELKKHLRVRTIWWEDKPVATIVLLVEATMAYYWLAGGDHNYFRTGLNQVLLWQVIRELCEQGPYTFDFMGANTPSISNYKSGYNFELVSYYRVFKETGRIARRLMTVKRFIRGS